MAIFTVFQPGDITKVKATEVTAGLWSPDDTGSLSVIYTSSVQVGVSGVYYYDMYDSTAATQEVQFSVAYGHRLGSGSPTLANLATSVLPTQVIYSQYRNILLGSGSSFLFNDIASDDIYVINISRARLKQALDPGNWTLGLRGVSGSFSFTDDSGLGVAVTGNYIASTKYNIRSGSAGTLAADTTIYGTVFSDYGVIILKPSAIVTTVGFVTASAGARTTTTASFAPYTGSAGGATYQYNHEALVRSISASMADGKPFIARSVEQVTSQNYFVRLQNDKYNYTNNPSFYTTVDGVREVLDVFTERPLTYPTTVGLYNAYNEMLAVAKLSRPIQKSEDKEALIRIRLDY